MSNKTSHDSKDGERIGGEPITYRPYIRHILTRDERIRAIKAYERVPMYTKVAKMFNCSWEQIKNIIANRDAILRSSDSLITWQNTDPNEADRKRRIIQFLGECVYEFIQRVQYHKKIDLSENLIRAKAIEFRDIMQIDNFVPNRGWISRFKTMYNFSLSNRQIVITRTPPQTLDLKDIISYCSRKRRENKNHAWSGKSTKLTLKKSQSSKVQKGRTQAKEKIIYLDAEDDEEKYIIPNTVIEEDFLPPPMKIHKVESIGDDDFIETESNSRGHWSEHSNKEEQSLLPQEVHSYDDALKLLAPLEEFAMLENNFRVIGLLSQLEEIFRNPPNDEKS